MTTPTADTTRSSPGWFAHLPVQGKLLLSLGLLLTLVLGNAAAYFYVQSRQAYTRAWTIHTYQVFSELQQLTVSMLDQLTGLRGYRLTLDDKYLDSYRNGVGNYGKRLSALQSLTADNPRQQALLIKVDAAMQGWRREVAEPSLAITNVHALRENAKPTLDLGKKYIDQFRETVAEMEHIEQELLVSRRADLDRVVTLGKWVTLAILLAGLLLVVFVTQLLRRLITGPLVQLTELMTRLSNNDLTIVVPDTRRRDEIGALAKALQVFKNLVVDIKQRNWVKTQSAEIAARLQAVEQRAAFANALTGALSPLLGAGVASFYLRDEHSEALDLLGHYGHLPTPANTRCKLGEGLVGECAQQLKAITLNTLPQDYLRIESGTGGSPPQHLLLLPVHTQGQLLGVIEFASFSPFQERHHALLDELLPTVALALDNLQRALRTRELLEESKSLTEELQASSEELRVQQEELRVQAEELNVTNEELRLKGDILIEQKQALESLQADTEEKAQDLERASQYKSEFLANMSHELRTPLNSLLILSRGLADNEEGHLSADEVESASVIHEAGSSLLRLINDILDLAKVESGKVELVVESVPLDKLVSRLNRNFSPIAHSRGLQFDAMLADGLPAALVTDGGKLEQILNNLLSNAFKFTQQGGVTLSIARPEGARARQSDIAFAVSDTGIGIDKDKFEKVFQAFEQVDGSTSRQFGGTGLGLAIARNMAQQMGGDIRLDSTPGQGSTFTLLLPDRLDLKATTQPHEPAAATQKDAAPTAALPAAASESLPDDRATLGSGDTVILIVEDDLAFARILIDLVRRKGYRALFAANGEAGLTLAKQYKPNGILLDVMLPGMDGYTVIEKLKADPATRHLPVHFISAADEQARGMSLGAVGFLTKPVSREGLNSAFERLLHFAEGNPRRVLVVDDDAGSRLAVRKLISGEHIEISEAHSGRDALAKLQAEHFDCIVLDLGMPDMDGFAFLEQGSAQLPLPPVVIYSGRALSDEETIKLRQYTDSIVIKGARSPERLLDEVTLFLHSIRDTPTRQVPENDRTLNARTVLLVDDDMRNIFALSKTLRAKGLTVVMAQDGHKALKQLEDNPNIELVLMDIMMPGMDGYQAMGEIRKNPKHQRLPIIALTAKAMQGDREKCLAAGANDYLSKPIDLDKLFSMMRVWLSTA